MILKSSRWSGILYPENMPDNWEDIIEDKLQLPACYIIHQPEKDETKVHVHIMIIFPDNTTKRHALNVLNLMSVDEVSSPCCSTVESILDIGSLYDYFIHNTKSCIRAGKIMYEPDQRVELNGFDIRHLIKIEDFTLEEIRVELSEWILVNKVCSYSEVYKYALSFRLSGDLSYEKAVVRFSAHFDRMCRAEQYKKKQAKDEAQIEKEKNSIIE